MISYFIIGLGALCLVAGFYLVVRGIGGKESQGSIKLLGATLEFSNVGQGIVFAALGVLLVGLALYRPSEADPGTEQAPVASPSPAPSSPAGPATPTPGPSSTTAGPAASGTPLPAQATTCVSVITGQIGQDLTIANRCGLTSEQARAAAVENVRFVLGKLESIQSAKGNSLFPWLEAFRENPTRDNWMILRTNSQAILKSVRATAEAIMRLDARSAQTFGPEIVGIARNLAERTRSFTALDSYGEEGPRGSQIADFARDQYKLFTDCQVALDQIKRGLAD